jgi:hypothetical protein
VPAVRGPVNAALTRRLTPDSRPDRIIAGNTQPEIPMLRFLAFVSAVMVGAAVFAVGDRHPTLSAATPAMAEPFWRCPPGYTFETSGSAVHCKKPAWTQTKAVMPCMNPTPDLKTDLVNLTDMCSGGIGIAVTAEPLCPPLDVADGFTKRHVAGRDFCGKFHPAEIIPPNLPISF